MTDKPKGEKRFEIEEDLSKAEIPEILPVLPLRGIVIFPSQIHPFLVSRPSSLKLIDECGQTNKVIALAAQKNPEDEQPAPEGLFPRGTAVRILKMLRYPGSERAGAGAGTGANRAGAIHPARAVLPRARQAAGRAGDLRQGNRRAARAPGQPVFQIRFAGAVPARRIAGDGDAGEGGQPAGRHGRLVPEDSDRRGAGSAGDARRSRDGWKS